MLISVCEASAEPSVASRPTRPSIMLGSNTSLSLVISKLVLRAGKVNTPHHQDDWITIRSGFVYTTGTGEGFGGSPVGSAARVGDELRPFEHGGPLPLVLVEEPLVDRPQQATLQRTTVADSAVGVEGQRSVVRRGSAGNVAERIGTHQSCSKC